MGAKAPWAGLGGAIFGTIGRSLSGVSSVFGGRGTGAGYRRGEENKTG